MPRVPKIVVEPLVKLSKEQWKAYVARMLAEGGRKEWKITPEVASRMFKRFEPPVEKEVGTLFTKGPEGLPKSAERLPIEQARAKYFENPEEYLTPTTYAPPMKEVAKVPVGSPEELAAGVAYNRVKSVPIIPPSIGKAQRTIQGELQDQAMVQQLRNVGVSLEDIRPGVTPRQALAEKGIRPTEAAMPPIVEQIQVALIADRIWKDMGGARSMGGKLWEMYRESSRQAPHIKTGRDYFISCLIRWQQDPVKFAKAHPREANLIKNIQDSPAVKESFDLLRSGR